MLAIRLNNQNNNLQNKIKLKKFDDKNYIRL